MANSAVIYPGSFDPLTLGHANIVERAAELFDRVIVAVAKDSSKTSLFTPEERQRDIAAYFSETKRVEVVLFKGLLVEFATETNVFTLLRGIRTVSDFEYELGMAQSNKELNPRVETIFMATDPAFSFISSTIARQVALLHGDVRKMVPQLIATRLEEKIGLRK